jgi:glycosyltransferase involved in cell wall biosynthesis
MENRFEKGLVSIVIPTFNHVHFADEMLASVTGQTYSNLQIIVCDDCSDDGTAEKILDWAKRDNRIVAILSNENCGLSININKGLDRAAGEFLALMGGDDKMALDKIRKQVDFLRAHPDYDVVLHWVEVFDSTSGRQLNIFNSNISKSPVDWFLPKVSFGISKKNNDSIFPPTAYLARSDYALHSRFDYRLKYKNEVLFAIDNFMKKPDAKWSCIPEILGYYRMHERNMHKSKEMNDALLEETYINYAIASARYPSLSGRFRRGLQYFLYRDLYYRYWEPGEESAQIVKLAKGRFRMESDLFLYIFAMAFLKAKLFYRRILKRKP